MKNEDSLVKGSAHWLSNSGQNPMAGPEGSRRRWWEEPFKPIRSETALRIGRSHRPSPQKDICMHLVGMSFQGTVEFPEAYLLLTPLNRRVRTEDRHKERTLTLKGWTGGRVLKELDVTIRNKTWAWYARAAVLSCPSFRPLHWAGRV